MRQRDPLTGDSFSFFDFFGGADAGQSPQESPLQAGFNPLGKLSARPGKGTVSTNPGEYPFEDEGTLLPILSRGGVDQ